MDTEPVGECVPPPAGKCRVCAEDTWRSDELCPAHPCCVIHARESPGVACPACEASRKARRRAEVNPLLRAPRGG